VLLASVRIVSSLRYQTSGTIFTRRNRRVEVNLLALIDDKREDVALAAAEHVEGVGLAGVKRCVSAITAPEIGPQGSDEMNCLLCVPL